MNNVSTKPWKQEREGRYKHSMFQFKRTTEGTKGNSVLNSTMPATLPKKWAGITTNIFEGAIRPVKGGMLLFQR